MSFSLPDLPYSYDALAPYMSRETLEYHHDKHHLAYVNNGNKLLKDSAFEGKSLEQVVKAVTLVLQAGNFGVVAFDVADAPPDAIRRLPFTTWLRLQRMIEGSQTLGILVGSEPMARSSAGLTVQLEINTLSVAGSGRRFRGRLFAGVDVEARVIRARARWQEQSDVRVPLSTCA